MISVLLLGLEFLYVSVVIIFLYRLKPKFGSSLLFIFIGSNQYLQTILASSFYLHFGDFSISPGSVILFSSSLFAVLLVYIKDGVKASRTLIYGILLANISLTVLTIISYGQYHIAPNSLNNLEILPSFYKINMRQFIVGSFVLLLDSVLLILTFDYLKYRLKFLHFSLRILFSLTLILIVDSIMYSAGNFIDQPNFKEVLVSQLIGKSIAAFLFSGVLFYYLKYFDPETINKDSNELESKYDIFSILTYREKYSNLKIESEQKLKKQLAEIQSLNSIFRKISRSMSIESFVENMVEELALNTSIDLVFLFKTKGYKLELIGSGPKGINMSSSSNLYEISHYLCGISVKTRTPQFFLDIFEDNRCNFSKDMDSGIKSFCAIPLINDDEVIGVIGVASKKENDFSARSNFYEALASEATIVLVNSLLHSDLKNKSNKLMVEVEEKQAALNHLVESEQRFFHLFNNSPFSILEEDFGECLKYLDQLIKEAEVPVDKVLEDENVVIQCSSLVRILNVNEKALSLYKAKSKSQLLENLSNILLPESIDVFRNGLIALYNNSTNFEAESVNKTLEGEKIDIFISWNVVHFKNNINRVIVSLIDTTEQKRAENEIKQVNYRLNKAQSIAHMGFLDWNFNTNEIYLSDEVYNIYGFPKDTVNNKIDFINQAIHPDDLEFVQQNLKSAIRGGKYNIDHRIIRPSGELVWVNAQAELLFDDAGNPKTLLGTIVDITDRIKAEEKLSQISAERKELESIVNKSQAIAFLWRNDENWSVEYVSDNIEQFGYSREELLSGALPFARMVHTDDLERVVKEVSRYSNSKADNFVQEYRIITKSKEVKWVEDRTWIRRNQKNKITHYQGIVLDITDRKNSEFALKEYQKRLLKAEEIAKLGFWDWDILTNDIYLSEEVYKLYGLPRKNKFKVIEFMENAVHPDDLKFVNKNLNQALKNEKKYNIDHRIIKPDGDVIWVNAQAELTFDKNGKPSRLLGTIIDITERKVAETEIIKSHTRNKEILDSMTNGYILADEFGRIVEVNHAYCDYIGYTRDELLGSNISELEAALNTEQLREKISTILKAGNVSFESAHRHKNGSIVEFEATFSVISEDNKTFVAAFLRDITEIKRKTEETRMAYKQLKQTLEKMSDGFVSLDTNWNYTYVNMRAGQILGKNSEELLGKNIWEVFPEGIGQPFYKNYYKAVETQEQINFSAHYQPWDKWFINRVIPSKDGLAIFFQDITDLKKAEATLAESEARYRTIVENSHNGIAIINDNSEIIYANEKLVGMFGYSLKEIVGSKIEKFLTEESKNIVLDNYRQRQKGEKIPSNYYTTIKQKSGMVRDIKISSSTTKSPSGKINTIAQLLDITDEKLAQSKLSASENKFRTLVEQAGDAMLLSDFDGNIIDFNNKACENLQYSPEELGKMKLSDISIFLDEQHELDILRKKLKTNQTILIQRTHIRKDGTSFPVEITMGLIEIENEKFVLGFARDITEREKIKSELEHYKENLELEVKQRTAQLEEANKELESFSYSVSHDLRAPLRHINGFIELLNMNSASKLDEKSIHYLETIQKASDQMGILIDELLDFSRMGRASMSFTDINILELINVVKEELLGIPENSKRQITWHIGNMPVIKGDVAMLRTVFNNLISNSIKYTAKKKKARININCDLSSNYEYIFHISDNGAGFDMHYADKLFGVFQRLHSKQEFEGAGIGLANVRRIINRHGGRTWAEGEVNKGAKFYFTLPKESYEI